ncbi:MAG: hypothetical protein QUS09_11065 [Methanotrichaceae archaeon]|nr:hypothetical protein [Methanotrichaceae archaeon]
MNVKMEKEGLLIPKSILDELGDFEVLNRGREILIRPKTHARRYLGFAREGEYDEELVKKLEESYQGRGED